MPGVDSGVLEISLFGTEDFEEPKSIPYIKPQSPKHLLSTNHYL